MEVQSPSPPRELKILGEGGAPPRDPARGSALQGSLLLHRGRRWQDLRGSQEASDHGPQCGVCFGQGLHEKELPWRRPSRLLGADGMWPCFEQREPLGDGSEGEGEDGQFQVPPDHIGQDGSAIGFGRAP